jgi:hypothetical protein
LTAVGNQTLLVTGTIMITRATAAAAHEDPGRRKLLSLVDSLVIFFNLADLDSLLSMLAVRCSENVAVKTCLEAPASTNNRKSLAVLAPDDRVVPYITQERSVESVSLVWVLLYAAHPDGVMTVIDRRICYRTYQTRSTDNSTVEDELAPPASILEVVVTMCGFCAVPQLLQRVLVRASSTIGTSQQSVLACQPHRSADRNANEHRHSSAKRVSGSTQDSRAAVKSNALWVVHAVERLIEEFVPNPYVHTRDQRSSSASSEGPIAMNGRWRYLIEFRLQFDEHDLVTHWTTTMLATEPEEILLKPQLRL